jgi:uncharacterized membrane protein YphA (DoxX/SURF4 family)
MNYALWSAQAILAVVFLVTGSLKLTQPIGKLAKSMEWVKSTPTALVRLLGRLEVLGALGLILPTLTGILPWLTPLAAVGMMIVMLGASAHHASRHEYQKLGFTIVLFLLAAFVAYGRFFILPG